MRSRKLFQTTPKPSWTRRLTKFVKFATVGSAICGAVVFGILYLYLSPKLPDIETLQDVEYSVPLRIYTSDEKLIAEYGQKKRTPADFKDIPQRLVNAFVAAEDSRYFEHGGVDYRGLARAVFYLIKTRSKGQGGSTITMQVARNFFLSPEKTYLRKINEIFLSWKIEDKFSKQKIIELYLNKIYLGNRAYGVGAAAEVYYGKSINELSLAQAAMIAGLPKAPSRYNPIINPRRALLRRSYVLRRMKQLNFINEAEYTKANDAVDEAALYAKTYEIEAPYLTEMVRDKLLKQYGEDIYTSGFKVYTTIDAEKQSAANLALRHSLLEYDHRHGYRGPIDNYELKQAIKLDSIDDETYTRLDQALEKFKSSGHLLPAMVVDLTSERTPEGEPTKGSVIVFQPDFGEFQAIPWKGLSWAKPFIDRNTQGNAPKSAADILSLGDIIYVEQIQDESGEFWRLAQPPEAEGALVSLSPSNGAILAIVGGFDFQKTKFNRVTQAKRQPGSNFKPIIYSAALAKCFTPASIINDSPIVITDAEGNPWRPQNDNGRVSGPMRLRVALTKSVNLVSIRILQAIGVSYAIDYAKQFGFITEQMPRNLTLALGSLSVTPLSIARAYSTFANGGFLVDPFFISKIIDSKGNSVYLAPKIVFEADVVEEEKQITLDFIDDVALPKSSTETQTMANPDDSKIAINKDEDAPPLDIVSVTTPREIIAKRIISKKNAFLMSSILRDVVKLGTGRRALALGRKDLAGKTGTTNDQVDAWFSGFNHKLVTTAWVGFDQPQTLGQGEYGGRAALPMWMKYMRVALNGIPELALEQPAGISSMRIDPKTGKTAPPGRQGSIFEFFSEQCQDSQKQGGMLAISNNNNDNDDQSDETPPDIF